jgi:uncharacterized membrane protein YhhN
VHPVDPPVLRNDRALAFLALIAPIAYLLLLGVKPYPGDVILKTSLCALLALLAWRHEKRLLAVALLFSALGDALLDLNGAKLFVPALASFLITHLLYATMFLRVAKLRFARLQVWRLMLLVLVPLFAIAYTMVLWPKLGNLSLPVACYIAAIVAMTVFSLRVPVAIVPIGAGLFLISDSLIALEKFLWQAGWIGPTIWITYAAAQLLIAYGMVLKHRHTPI